MGRGSGPAPPIATLSPTCVTSGFGDEAVMEGIKVQRGRGGRGVALIPQNQHPHRKRRRDSLSPHARPPSAGGKSSFGSTEPPAPRPGASRAVGSDVCVQTPSLRHFVSGQAASCHVMRIPDGILEQKRA